MTDGGPILFFDGECGLCARSVSWCLKHDRRRVIRFAPLQGRTYAALEDPEKSRDLTTMVLTDDRGLHVRSEAVLRLMGHVGGVWALTAMCLRVLPRRARDWWYRQVAKRRRRWFRDVGECMLVRSEDRGRFLP